MARKLTDIEKQVEALRQDLTQAHEQADRHEGAVSAIDQQRAEAVDRLKLALRQVEDFRGELERKEAELAEARREAAVTEAHSAIERRDTAARDATEAIAALTDALQQLTTEREEVEQRTADLADSGVSIDVPPEPPEFDEAMGRLTRFVRGLLDEQLEDEILEAAARSTRAQAIEDLPPHLQEAARNRRRDLARQRWND